MSNRRNRLLMLPIVVLQLFIFSCKENMNKQGMLNGEQVQTNKDNDVGYKSCYILKPVYQNATKGNSEKDFWPAYNDQLKLLNISVDSFLAIKYFFKDILIDSQFRYITSYNYQTEIIVNDNCLESLEVPDNIFLQQIYFPLQSKPYGNYSQNPATLVSKSKRNILNLGKCEIFEYKLKAADVSPNALHIILRETEEQEMEFRHGYVLCSDGIEWKAKNAESIPIFIENINNLSIKIPLYFDGERFIPINGFISANSKDVNE